jgi:uncharacterized repeat protein (TIGR01451 family)
LTSNDLGSPALHLPVAVMPSSGILPDLVEVHTRRNAGSQWVESLQSIEAPELTIDSHGLAQADLTDISLSQDPTRGNPFDDLDDVFYTTITVPAGTRRLVAEIIASEAPDPDLYVGTGSTPSAGTIICASTTPSWQESCDLSDPVDGTYWVLVQSWEGSADQPDLIHLATAVVPSADLGNMTVVGPASVDELEPFDLQLFWNTPAMEAGDRWYGAFSLGSEPGSEGNIGTIPVNIIRHEDDVIKEVSSDSASFGETLTYTISVLPNVTPVDLAYQITDTIPEGLTYVPGSAMATAGTVNVVDDTLTWNGTIHTPEPFYTVTTRSQDESCAMPFTNSGGYVDLRAFGINPNAALSGDTMWWLWNTSGAAPIQFFGNEVGNAINFTDDGFAFFDPSTPGAEPWENEDIPNAADPNHMLAVFWKDLEIVYEAGVRGITLVNLASGGIPVSHIIDYKGVQVYQDPTQRYDVQFFIRRYVNDTPGAYEIIFAYDNLVGDLDIGTIGLENITGTEGVKYAYNDAALAALEDGMAICFDWFTPTGDPVTISYQVTVDEPGVGSPLTNEAIHDTDNEGSLPAVASVDVQILGLFYGLELAPLFDVASGDPGEVVVHTLTLTNTGNVLDTFTLEAGVSNWDVGLPNSVTVPGYTSIDVDVSVTIPTDAMAGASNAVAVTVTSTGDPNLSSASVLFTIANTVYDVAMTPTEAAQSGLPGEVITYTLAITNTGNATDGFTFSVSGNNWSVDLPGVVPLVMGQSADVEVKVTIPADAAGGAFDVATVRATSTGDSNASAASELTTTAENVYDVDLSAETPAKAGLPGEIVTYTLTVTNEGNVMDTFNFTAEDYVWDVDLPAPVTLAMGVSADVEVTVTIPANAAAGATDMVTVIATSDGDPSATAAFDLTTLTTTADAVYGVQLTPAADAKSGLPGTVVTYTLSITNTGNITDVFSFADTGDWLVGLPSPVTLGMGLSADIEVTVTIPADAAGGAFDVATVTVTSAGDSNVIAHSVLTTTAVNVHGVALTPVTDAKSSAPGTTVHYTLQLTNQGNITDTFNLTQSGASWTVALSDVSVELAAGASTEVTVSVTIPANAADGASDTVTITATSQSDEEVTATSTLTTTAEWYRIFMPLIMKP